MRNYSLIFKVKLNFFVKDETFTRNHLVISMHQSVGPEVTEYDMDFILSYENLIKKG